MARRIARETTSAYGATSKGERGYALSAGKRHRPAFADDIIITPDTSFVGLKKFFDLNVASAEEATSLSR